MLRAVIILSLLAGPAAAQRPSAEPTRQAVNFWPLDAASGAAVFAGISARSGSDAQQAAHLRAWLTSTYPMWEEWQSGNDSTLLFRGQMVGGLVAGAQVDVFDAPGRGPGYGRRGGYGASGLAG